MIRGGEAKFVRLDSNRVTVWDLAYHGERMRVVYDKQRQTPITVLTREMGWRSWLESSHMHSWEILTVVLTPQAWTRLSTSPEQRKSGLRRNGCDPTEHGNRSLLR